MVLVTFQGMKVLMVSDYYPPHIGGIQSHVFDLTQELRRRGVEVKVVARGAGENVVSVPYVNVRYLRGLTFMFSLFFILLRCFKWKPDVIHCHSYQPAFIAMISKRLYGFHAPVVITSHGKVAESVSKEKGWLYRSTVGLVAQSLEIFSSKKCDFLISVDESFHKYALRFVERGKIMVIPNWVDGNRFKKMHVKKEFPEPLILCPRRLDKKNGLGYAVRSLKILKDKNIGAKLMIIGDGDDKYNVVKLVSELGLKDDVIMTGSKPREEIIRYTNMADIILLPSPTGNFNFSLLESWACEKPVVMTDTGTTFDFPEVNETTGIICRQTDEDIAAKLQGALCGKYNLVGIARNGRKAVETRFSLRNSADEIERVYLRLTS